MGAAGSIQGNSIVQFAQLTIPNTDCTVQYLGERSSQHQFVIKSTRDGIFYLLKTLPVYNLDPNQAPVVDFLLQASYPHIIKYFNYAKKDNFYFFVSDLLNFSVSDFYTRYSNHRVPLDERIILLIIRDILRGLDLFHEQNIVHNNININNVYIKYQNIAVLGEPNIFLSSSSSTNSYNATSNNNDSEYISPEVIDGNVPTTNSDLFSAGCIAYYLAMGRTPFYSGGNVYHTIKLISQGKYNQISGNYSKYLKDMVSRLLDVNPENRGTISEYLYELNNKLGNLSLSMVVDENRERIITELQNQVQHFSPHPSSEPIKSLYQSYSTPAITTQPQIPLTQQISSPNQFQESIRNEFSHTPTFHIPPQRQQQYKPQQQVQQPYYPSRLPPLDEDNPMVNMFQQDDDDDDQFIQQQQQQQQQYQQQQEQYQQQQERRRSFKHQNSSGSQSQLIISRHSSKKSIQSGNNVVSPTNVVIEGQMSDEQIQQMNELFKGYLPQTTTVLKLSDRDIDNKLCKYLVKYLQMYKHVTELYLQDNNLKDSGLQALTPAIGGMKYLKILLLFNINIQDSGAEYIASILPYLQDLHTFSLAGNHIRDRGMKFVAESLTLMKKLTVLNLDGNNITNKGAWEIVSAVKNLPTLNKLTLGKCDSGNDKVTEGDQMAEMLMKGNRQWTNLFIQNKHYEMQ